MKKIDLGQGVTILANIGVLIGLFLLVHELNQNRQMMEAQTRTALADGIQNWIYNVAADSETSELVDRGNRGEELTDSERNRYLRFLVAQLRYYENVHYQYRNGLYDEIEFAAQRRAWRDAVFNNTGMREFFCDQRDRYSPEFVAEIESLLVDHPCE